MLAEGRVFGSGGTGIAEQIPAVARFTKHACMAVSDAAGHFYEYAVRGRAWHVHTAVAGVNPGTAIGTAAGFALFNAKGSGVNVIVLWGALGEVSGATTIGAGTIDWCTNVNLSEAVPTGTAIVARPCLVGGPLPQGGVALTAATLAVTPNPVRVFCSTNEIAQNTGTTNPVIISDLVDGVIVLPPGGSVSLQATADAGAGTPKVVYSVLFAEEPI